MLKIGIIGEEIYIDLITEINNSAKNFKCSGLFFPARTTDINDFKHFHNIQELIEESDAIIILTGQTPSFTLIADILKKSKHLFLSDHHGLGLKETNELLRLMHEANVKVRLRDHDKLHPLLQEAYQSISFPSLIDIRNSADTNKLNGHSPDTLTSTMKDISTILFLNRSNVNKIYATGFKNSKHLFSFINCRLEFENGCVANITNNRLTNNSLSYIEMFLPDENIYLNFKNNEIMRFKSNSGCEDKRKVISDFPIDFYKTKDYHPTLLIKELELFIDSIYTDSQDFVNVENHYETLCIQHQLKEKLNRNSSHTK